MRHIAGFDSLRAIAVIAVLFFHLGWPTFTYGWLGVPFFFVLSGFLITGILLDNRDSGPRSYFMTFYTRRCLRIFPLYFLYLAVIAVWCAWLDAKATGWPYFLLYVQNYYLGTIQFKMPPGMELGHTWSLAVEEQFYMLWPLVIFFASTKQLKLLIPTLITITVVSRYWITHNLDLYSFTPLTSNFDTLCLGALLAILYRESKSKLRSCSLALLLAGIGTVVIAYYLPNSTMGGFDSVFMFALALFFAGVVGLTASGALPSIQWKLLSYIGKISYGLYIWHALAYNIVNGAIYHHWMPDYGAPAMDALRLAITFIFAIASFHLFELPILRIKDRIKYDDPASERIASA